MFYFSAHMDKHFVEWCRGENAGGQVSNDTFHTNPQITLDFSSRKYLTLLGQMIGL